MLSTSLCRSQWFDSPSIMPPSGWYRQRKAEQGAGLTSDVYMLFAFDTCDTCGICIGYDHAEEELYLYPLSPGQEVHWLSKGDAQREYYSAPTSPWLYICGSCARRRTRNLSPEWCLISSLHWHTTLLIMSDTLPYRAIDQTNEQEVLAVDQACRQHILNGVASLLFLSSLSLIHEYALSPSLAFALFTHWTQEKREKKQHPTSLPNNLSLYTMKHPIKEIAS